MWSYLLVIRCARENEAEALLSVAERQKLKLQGADEIAQASMRSDRYHSPGENESPKGGQKKEIWRRNPRKSSLPRQTLHSIPCLHNCHTLGLCYILNATGSPIKVGLK